MFKKLVIKNYASFKDETHIDFTDETGKVSNLLLIKGANGSGKTNVIKAINFLSDFVSNGHEKNVSSEIDIESFFDNEEPSEFKVTFLANEFEVDYFLKVNKTQVLEEKFSIEGELLAHRVEGGFEYLIDDLSEIGAFKLRKNASFVSIVEQYNLEDDTEALLFVLDYFFTCMMTNVSSFDGYKNQIFELSNVSEEYYRNEDDVRDFLVKGCQLVDTSIKDVRILKEKNSSGEEVYFPVFEHILDGNSHFIPYYKASSGIQKTFEIWKVYHLALKTRGVIVLDEIDIHLHPHILPNIIEIFGSSERSQFIFTSHNDDIMDFIKLESILLVDKKNCASSCHKASDVSLSSDERSRKTSTLYKEGCLGGVPENSKYTRG
ncbi:AAA family ATPase [Vibrio atlanticus]|uniref:AAA family ATPase n=1 Tax=Vibrio atlanticus TaxID=693153 RepID=UPI000EFA9E58|nr:ATP-binding protein [Vibrio atlanticus]